MRAEDRPRATRCGRSRSADARASAREMTAPLDRALTTTAPARARLERIYGRVPAVIAFLQREDGPVTIHRCLRLVGTVEKLYRAGDGEIAVRAVVPGGRALENWFRREGADALPGDDGHHARILARAFGVHHARHFSEPGNMATATVETLRFFDSFLADFERLYLNGSSYAELAALTGTDVHRVEKTLNTMRSLGFELPHRRIYTRRARA